MPSSARKPPAWSLPIERVSRVDLFRVSDRDFIRGAGWSETFWAHPEGQLTLGEEDTTTFLRLFQRLEAGEMFRCHMPPWAATAYAGETPLFAVAFCFQCSNASVFTPDGRTLRTFDEEEANAQALLAFFRSRRPLPPRRPPP